LAPDVLCPVAASGGAVLDDPPTSLFWEDEKALCTDLRSIFFSDVEDGPGVAIAGPRAKDGAGLGFVEGLIDETDARDGSKGGTEEPSGAPVTDFLFIFLLFSIFSLSSRVCIDANAASEELEIDVGMPPSKGGEERGEEAAEDEAEDEDDAADAAAAAAAAEAEGSVPVLEDVFFFFLRPGRRGRLSPISEARLRELRERDVVCFVNSSAMLLRCSLPSSSADKEDRDGGDGEEDCAGSSFDPDKVFDIVATWTVPSVLLSSSLLTRSSEGDVILALFWGSVRGCDALASDGEIAWRGADGRGCCARGALGLARV